MYINWQLRELNLKIVYYGPALSGKTTNLEFIHNRVPAEQRSDMVSLKTHEDRTLYFDFLQIELGKIGGLTPKLHLYTVPGQAYYEASRRLVLRGADGVVFVSDSTPGRIQANIRAWQDLFRHLRSLDLPVENTPIIIQHNKQDAVRAMSVEFMNEVLRTNDYPSFGAVAIEGHGVFETFRSVTKHVVARLHKEMA